MFSKIFTFLASFASSILKVKLKSELIFQGPFLGQPVQFEYLMAFDD